MRSIGISYREFSKDEWEAFSAENNNWAGDDDKDRLDESDMTMIGIFGLRDVLRSQSIVGVDMLRSMGVNVRIVTGDNRVATGVVATVLGVATQDELNQDNVCVEAPDVM